MLEQTLIPSPHVTELDADPIATTTSRFASAAGDISERYHLASRLTARSFSQMVSSGHTASFVRQWQLESAAEGASELQRLGSSRIRSVESLPPPLGVCLAAYREVTPDVAPLFAVDIVVAADRALWRLVAGTGQMTFEGEFDDVDADAVASALEAWPPGIDSGEAVFVFVVGVFVRAALLARTRGYRNTLINAGNVIGQMQTAWRMAERSAELLVISDLFLDDEVDRILRNDGVERATLAVLSFCPLGGSPPPARDGADNDED